MFNKTLDEKLARIAKDPCCDDFILADAKDADMAFGMASPGKCPESSANLSKRPWRTLQQYRDLIRENTEQGLIDIMLMSVSSSEVLTIDERLFQNSGVTPAIRANDTTDIWLARGGVYAATPSRPFRSASIDHAMARRSDDSGGSACPGVDLGLYSVTFNNDVAHDHQSLVAYHEFCAEAERKGFRHFLEVFDPNCPLNPVADVGAFTNDHIARALAGLPRSARPLFLKMVYHGPASLDELVSYDSSLVVGILGGSSGTTFDAFHQLWEAKKYGAQVALYGRMINNSEHQLSFIEHLRYLADGQLDDPAEAVRSYHGSLEKRGIRPLRTLDEDLRSTNRYFEYASKVQSARTQPDDETERETGRVDVIVAGHICLDITPQFPTSVSATGSAIQPGQLKVVGPADCSTGGSVANTGLTLHHLGVRTLLMGKIGNDPFGDQILQIIGREDAAIGSGMIVTPDENSSYSIVISPPGEDRSFLHFPGANDTFTASDVRLDRLNNSKLFHFGYPPLMARFWNDGGAEMSRLFRSVKELAVTTSLDMAMPDPTSPAGRIDWRAWLKRVLPDVDLFMPSLDEIRFMLDPQSTPAARQDVGDVDPIDWGLLSQTADQLLKWGVGIVVLKLGAGGLYLKSSEDADRVSKALHHSADTREQWVGRELYAPCFEVSVGSTNGAGDRTIAGLLAAIVRNLSPEKALQMAVAVGAASVESSKPVGWDAINDRIQAGWKRRSDASIRLADSDLEKRVIC